MDHSVISLVTRSVIRLILLVMVNVFAQSPTGVSIMVLIKARNTPPMLPSSSTAIATVSGETTSCDQVDPTS